MIVICGRSMGATISKEPRYETDTKSHGLRVSSRIDWFCKNLTVGGRIGHGVQ